MILSANKTVGFDPAIKEHREAVRMFMQRNAWVDSPLRFSFDPAYNSIVEQVQAKLLVWYMQNDK